MRKGRAKVSLKHHYVDESEEGVGLKRSCMLESRSYNWSPESGVLLCSKIYLLNRRHITSKEKLGVNVLKSD